MVKAYAPGKLYIAGEYAVVNNGNPAIIVAINRFVTVKVMESKNGGSIASKQYKKNLLHWKRVNSQLILDDRDNPFEYVLSAIKVVEEYATLNNKKLKNYDIVINSELDSKDGRKYGLGSSAAVTVATIRALSQFYGLQFNKMELFKLAAIAHFEVQGNGSLGDVAASVLGGWIAYHSFDRQWLAQARRNADLSELLRLPWPDLEIKQLDSPADLKLLIGWTGAPASTFRLVDRVELKKAKNSREFRDFLTKSRQCVNEIVTGFEHSSLQLIKSSINENRKLLEKLSDLADIHIETPLLKQLIKIADKFGGASKSSGAGGGDCGIVIINKNEEKNIHSLKNEWKKVGIETLNFKVFNGEKHGKQTVS